VFVLRKTWLALALVSSAAAQTTDTPKLTARQVIEQIQNHSGAPWQGPTVDTFKAGDPDTPVTGIATTFTASYDVLERAAAAGANLIVAHEPTFYNHQDQTTLFTNDPVYQQKLAFIQSHHLVVWRFHDHWHYPAMNPDGIMRGMIDALGWQSNHDPANPMLFNFPETTLEGLVSRIQERMHIRTLRVVGDRRMKLRRIAFLPGAAGMDRQIQALELEGVDALVAGESRELETVLYAYDAIQQHRAKALVLLGHVPSEEEGMRYCAEWLKRFLPGVKISYMPAGEPFWTTK
jgi:putative NIF3 family GTP cyclohydrolase 1 type 2